MKCSLNNFQATVVEIEATVDMIKAQELVL